MSLFQPRFMFPQNADINSLITNTFSCQIQGDVVKSYQLTILSNATNINVYQTAIVDISSTPLYGGDNPDTLYVSIPSTSGMTNSLTSNYKWKIRLYDNFPANPTFIDSQEVYFQARNPVTIDILNITSSVTSKSISPQGIYSQNEGIAIKYYNFSLYDLNNVLIKSSGDIYNSRLSWNFDGLISGENYSLIMQVENQDSTILTITKLFTVSYSAPVLNFTTNTTVLKNLDAIQVDWSRAFINPGKTTGNFPYYEFINNSLHLLSDNTLYYDESTQKSLNIPEIFSSALAIILPLNYIGDIIKFENTNNGNYYLIKYNGFEFEYHINDYVKLFIAPNANDGITEWSIIILPNGVTFTKLN